MLFLPTEQEADMDTTLDQNTTPRFVATSPVNTQDSPFQEPKDCPVCFVSGASPVVDLRFFLVSHANPYSIQPPERRLSLRLLGLTTGRTCPVE